MNFVTFAELNADIIKNIARLPKDIDLVVGVPRSGMLVANMISLYLNKPLADLESFLQKNVFNSGSTKSKSGWKTSFKEIKNVLVVEDSVCSGKSISEAKEKISKVGFTDKNIKYLAAYAVKNNTGLVDCYFRTVDTPRAFEWNYLHIKLLENFCFDIDGILCEDPTSEQNDDGEKYRNFLLNAKPNFIPTQKIGCLVTSRLEKYRKETETWLSAHNIRYGELCMMNLSSAEERRKRGNHAEFKAGVYKKKKNMIFFIESEENQAREIRHLSGKAVFCPAAQKKYDESIAVKTINSSAKSIKSFLYPYVPEFLLRLYRKTKR